MNAYKAAKELSRLYQERVHVLIDSKNLINFQFIYRQIDSETKRPYLEIHTIATGNTVEEIVKKFHDEMTFHDMNCLICLEKIGIIKVQKPIEVYLK